MSCPGLVPTGVETDALIDFTDLLPTFAELGGAELPDGLVLDGKSFAPLMLGRTRDSPREWIMALGHGPARLDEHGVRGQNDYADRVVRDKRYKAWVDGDRRIVRLYDLKADPLEKRNLLDSQEREHRAALRKFEAVVAATPQTDARPRYRKRPPRPWDKSPKRAD